MGRYINEPDQMAMMIMLQDAVQRGDMDRWQSPTVQGEPDRRSIVANLPVPEPRYGLPFIAAHHVARDIIRARTSAKVGWSIANGALTSTPGNEEKFRQVLHDYEDLYLEASRGDDFVGVQSYSSQAVDANGLVPHPEHPDNTLVGTAFRPDALGMTIRHTAEVT